MNISYLVHYEVPHQPGAINRNAYNSTIWLYRSQRALRKIYALVYPFRKILKITGVTHGHEL